MLNCSYQTQYIFVRDGLDPTGDNLLICYPVNHHTEGGFTEVIYMADRMTFRGGDQMRMRANTLRVNRMCKQQFNSFSTCRS